MIILIAGGSSTGKSTLAKELSKKLKINLISSDDIRIAIQQTHNKNNVINFFLQKNIFNKYDTPYLIKKHQEVNKIVCKGLEAVVSHNSYIKNNLIIEGDDILPEFIKQISKKFKNIKSIVLFEDNKKNIIKNINKRNRHLNKISKKELEKNIEFIYQDNIRILNSAKKNNLNILSTRPFKTILQRAMKMVN